MRTPRSKWVVIVAALVLYAATLFVEAAYYVTELGRGSYSPESDSIGIPIFQTAITLVVLAPMFVLLLWLSTRRYVAGARLTAWNSKTPIRGLLWTAIGGGLAAVTLLDGAIHGYYGHPISVIHRGALAYVFLLIRAAAIPRDTVEQAQGSDYYG